MLEDCWMGMTQIQGSGLILATRVGKHTDEFISQLVMNTEGKTDCQQWHTDGWGGYERVLAPSGSAHYWQRQNTTIGVN